MIIKTQLYWTNYGEIPTNCRHFRTPCRHELYLGGFRIIRRLWRYQLILHELRWNANDSTAGLIAGCSEFSCVLCLSHWYKCVKCLNDSKKYKLYHDKLYFFVEYTWTQLESTDVVKEDRIDQPIHWNALSAYIRTTTRIGSAVYLHTRKKNH